MAKFYEDPRSPIVAELIRQDFDFEEPEALRLIDMDETAHNTDGTIALGAGAACIAATAGTLALSGLTLPILLPAIGIGVSGVTYWNSKVAARNREMETQFLSDHPEVLVKVASKINAGESRDTIAAAFEQCLRAYRWGDMAQMARVLGASPATAPTETQPQSGIQNGEAQDAPRSETQALAQTVLEGVPNTAIAPGVAVAPSMQHIVSPVWNPAQDLGENPQSALIVGTPGSGKGMLISNAIRVLKGRVPNLKVFVIDPKADPKERGYWESIADTYRAYCLMDCPDPDEGAEWLLRCMDEFRVMPGPKLLIFDELMASATELELADPKTKALQRLKKFVVGLIGQGDSRGVWIWAMTQSPQVKDLGISGGARANLRVIGLVSPKNMTAVNALVSTQLIPKPDGGMDELRAIMDASPVKRAVFDGKIARWLPMPELENHSGFDRDSAKWDKPSPETRSPSPSIAPQSSLEVEPMDEPWEGNEAVEPKVYKTSIEDLKRLNEAADKRLEERRTQEKVSDRLFKILEMVRQDGTVSVKDIQKKLKLGTSLEAQQLAQMFCLRNKSTVQFKSKNNANSTVSYFIERVT
jgi:hypothetical protein